MNYARSQPGVVAVSMSWGGGEFSSEAAYDSYFTTPAGHIGGSGLAGGVTFVSASGDDGAGTEWPSVSPNVVAVGGTSLYLGGSTWDETAWSDSGGGIELVRIAAVVPGGHGHAEHHAADDAGCGVRRGPLHRRCGV